MHVSACNDRRDDGAFDLDDPYCKKTILSSDVQQHNYRKILKPAMFGWYNLELEK